MKRTLVERVVWELDDIEICWPTGAPEEAVDKIARRIIAMVRRHDRVEGARK